MRTTRHLLALSCVAIVAIAAPACHEQKAPVPSAPGTASAPENATARGDGGAIEKEIASVLGDPRFLDAKKMHDARDFRGEGKALIAALDKPLAPVEHCAVAFAAGHALLQADDVGGALAAFEEASSPLCPLAPVAKLRAAQMDARGGNADAALARAQNVNLPLVEDERNLVIADCHYYKNEHAAALSLYRAWIAKNAHSNRWVDVELKIAEADLEAADGERAKEAFDAATRVMVEAPKLEPDKAQDLRRRAALALGRDPSLTAEEHVRRARGWLDAGENAKALDEARIVANDAKARPEDACRAEIARAGAEHGKPAIADAWANAVKKCEKVDEELPTALYQGAKAAASAKRQKEAIAMYARVEEKFPQHRLADDARYKAAFVYKGLGDSEKFESMLSSIAATYPNGDMGDEGAFVVALAHIDRGDDAGAKPLLDGIIDREKGSNRSWATGGRASYFRGRIAERAGDVADAKGRYVDVIAGVPLGFYAWLASARLGVIDHALADATFKGGETKDEQEQPTTRPEREALTLARRLLSVGEIELAKRALAKEGLLAPDTSIDDKVQIARIYGEARKWDDGIAFSRGKTSELYAHFPTGKWRGAWEAAYPRAFEDDVMRESQANAIPVTLTWAIMREESSFMPEVKSSANAYGLMQLIVPTAQLVAKGTTFGPLVQGDEQSLKRPDVSIALGTRLLGQLRSSLSHPLFAIAAYNGGAGAVKKWLGEYPTRDLDVFVEQIPWDETRNYVKRVTMSQFVYAYLYDKKGYDELSQMSLVIAR